jgi:hypothetical protein
MIQKSMKSDPILDEIHRTRREISERFGGDLKAILEDARKRQEASGRPVWSRATANNTMHGSGGGEVAGGGESTPAAP